MTADATIIVNVYDGVRYLGECMDSIRRLQGGFPLQVIVVDDAWGSIVLSPGDVRITPTQM